MCAAVCLAAAKAQAEVPGASAKANSAAQSVFLRDNWWMSCFHLCFTAKLAEPTCYQNNVVYY